MQPCSRCIAILVCCACLVIACGVIAGECQTNPAQPGSTASPGTGGTINPKTGEVYPSVPGGALNPRTGEIYPEVPGGVLNPRTGEIYPRTESGRSGPRPGESGPQSMPRSAPQAGSPQAPGSNGK